MSICIQPDFPRKRVPFSRVQCEDCGTASNLSYEEWLSGEFYCPCGGILSEPNFYPTEFDWEEINWTASHLASVLSDMGVSFEYAGRMDPVEISYLLHKIRDQFDRSRIEAVVDLAIRLQVSIIWY